jgi:hypothetical protein
VWFWNKISVLFFASQLYNFSIKKTTLCHQVLSSFRKNSNGSFWNVLTATQGFLYLMFFMFSMAQRVYPKPWKLRITRWFWCSTFLLSEGIKTMPHSPHRLISVPSSEKRNFEIEIGAVEALEATLKTPSKNGFQHVFQQWQYPWWDKVLGGSIQRVS